MQDLGGVEWSVVEHMLSVQPINDRSFVLQILITP